MRDVFRTEEPDVDAYQMMTALIVPRPIAWISTVSASGVGNLAPHSFFSVACASPPIVSFTSVGRKDTLANILATGEFVINLAHRGQLERINNSSAGFDPDIDEAIALEIPMENSEDVRPQRVTDSPASIECRLHSTIDLGDSVLVLGSVQTFTLRPGVMVDGHPEMANLKPLSRLGKAEWGMPPEVLSKARPRSPSDIQ